MTKHDAERKVKILDFIAATLRARGFPPSVREIARAVGLASTSAVHHHLQILEKEGYLERGAAQSRAIRLTPTAALMLGLGPETTLLGRALERWGCEDAEELLHVLTRIDGPDEPEAGRLAGAVLDEAETGDEVAREIVETVAGRMGDYARVCATRTGQDGAPFPLVLCGSVLRHPSPLLRSVLLSRVPNGEPVYPDVEPVAGAVLLAADRVGARPGLARLGALLSPR